MKTKHVMLLALTALTALASGCSATLGVHSHPVPVYRERIIVPVQPHRHHGHGPYRHHTPHHHHH